MASRKISQFGLLPSLAGLEQFVLVMDGSNYRVTLNTIKASIGKADLGLSNVDNTSDLMKPVSTAVTQALAGKANLSHTHSLTLNDITGLDTALASKALFNHSHQTSEISGLVDTLNSKAPSVHTHSIDDIASLAQTLSMKAESGHVHGVETIVGLANILANKSDLSHIHALASVSGLVDALAALQVSINGKSAIGHTHVVNWVDIVGVPTSDGVTPHTHEIAGVNGLQQVLTDIQTALAAVQAPDLAGLQDQINVLDASKATVVSLNALTDIVNAIDMNKATVITVDALTDRVNALEQFGGGSGTVDLTAINNQITVINNQLTAFSNTLATKASIVHTHASADISDFTTAVNALISASGGGDSFTIYNTRLTAAETSLAELNSQTLNSRLAATEVVVAELSGQTLNSRLAVTETSLAELNSQSLNTRVSLLEQSAGGGGGTVNVTGVGLVQSTGGGNFVIANPGTDYMAPNVENTFTKPQKVSTSGKIQPASGSVSWDLNTHQVIRIELTSNVTTFNIQNLDLDRIGFDYKVVIIHKGGDLVFPANIRFPDGAAPALTLINNKIDTFSFMVESPDGVNAYLYCVGYALNM